MNEIFVNNINSINHISRIDFDILGSDEIGRLSVLGNTKGIDVVELYDNSEPKRGGLIDPRMGTTNNFMNCATCGLSTKFCPGHSGHIVLGDYVYHIGYLPTVIKILSCVCLNCSRLLIRDKNKLDLINIIKTKTSKERLLYVKNICKNVLYCQKDNFGCGAPHPKIKYEPKKKQLTIYVIAEYEGPPNTDPGKESTNIKKKITITAAMAYEILKNISNEDCDIMGIDYKRTRPEHMIYKILHVPSVQVRPSARKEFSGGLVMADDLTLLLSDIIKSNNALIRNNENKGENPSRFRIDHLNKLQLSVILYVQKDYFGSSQTLLQKGRIVKALSDRIKGKTGRIRTNLMGKRGDFTARTVITPDPSMRHNQIRVPIEIATNLTFPEVVTPYNIKFLSTLVSNGPYHYPGANMITINNSLGNHTYPIDLRYCKEGITLNYGDIVDRHLLNDDVVLLNRQPTLHKQSMMAFNIKVVDNKRLKTFGLSASVTKPYNADFDGDEMNVFVPQTKQTQVELREIASVDLQFIHPSVSRSSIGIVQDGLIGIYNMTSPTISIDWRVAMNILAYTSVDDYSKIQKTDISGVKLYSMIIPNKINLSMPSLKVSNGHIIEGRITTKNLGFKEKNTLIQLIWDEYGQKMTENFIDDTQSMANQFNSWYGFSIGYGDIERPPEMITQINNLFETKTLEIQHLITEIENNPELMKKDLLELQIYNKLKNINDETKKLASNTLSETNAFRTMMSSGSKGKDEQIGQIICCLGLQAFEGKLIPKKYNNRTLPYFHANDDTPESRGLIRKSFIDGLDWPNYIYLLLNGRAGLIDQAVKSVTGDTEIIILENDKIKQITIGTWIDEQLSQNFINVEHYKDRDMELLKLSNEIYIPTCDEDGNVSWGKITAITRHDPGNELYEIKTNGGRHVIVTESKSLLIWNDNDKKFLRMSTPDVKIGDFVPVTMNLCEPPVIKKYVDIDNVANKFILDYDNGTLIGLLLRHGKLDIDNNCISIHLGRCKYNTYIISLIINWFDKYNIKYDREAINSDSIKRGHSEIIVKFLAEFIGPNANNIPNDAFVSPEEFICGFLRGFICWDTNHMFKENTLHIDFSYQTNIINGINILFSRLNIFTSIDFIEKTLLIKDQWLKLFLEKIGVDDNKRTQENTAYIWKNDVVLDKIIEINKIDVSKYPKVYDLTVPSTLNFGLANGLHVVDTSETGYIQRKLIKSLEDTMIKYDGTVRNANDTIIQFVYGDSGANQISQFEYEISFLDMNNETLEKTYKFTDQELKLFPDFSKKENDEMYTNLINLRDKIRTNVQKAKLSYVAKVINFMIPVNLTPIIAGINDTKNNKKTSLSPKYILQQLENLLTNEMTPLVPMKKKEKENPKSFKYRDEVSHKIIFRAALLNILSPKRLLLEYNLPKETFDELVIKISQNYEKNIIEPGEMIGVLAACAAGEPVTQMIINSFHQTSIARSARTTQGVPRMKELFSVTKNLHTPQMTIYMTENKKDIVNNIASNLIYTVFGEIRDRINIYYDPYPKFKEGLSEKDNIIPISFSYKKNNVSNWENIINGLPWLLRVEINKEKMAEKEITLLDIISNFTNWWEVHLSDSKNLKKEERRIIKKFTQLYAFSNSDSNKVPIVHIRFNAIDTDNDKFDLNTIYDFIQHILDKFKLKGIDNIDNTAILPDEKLIAYDQKTGDVKNEKEFVIQTNGVNLTDIRYLSGIDIYRTLSNDIIQIYNTFGIEIARSILLKEFASAYSQSGGEINHQHIEIIVDRMTSTGAIVSIDRHGLNKSDAEPLARASFEKPIEQLWNAAIFGEIDNIKGVSSRIMCGQTIKGGTGYCNLILNVDMLEKAEYTESGYTDIYTEIKQENITSDILKKENEDIFMPL